MYHIKDILLTTDQIRLIMTLSQMYTFKLTCFSEIGINALIAGFIKCIGDIFLIRMFSGSSPIISDIVG